MTLSQKNRATRDIKILTAELAAMTDCMEEQLAKKPYCWYLGDFYTKWQAREKMAALETELANLKLERSVAA